MERLTEYTRIAGVLVGDLKVGVDEQKAFDRLTAYEDTDLEPNEITTEPYGCVFYCNRKCNLDGDFCAEGPGCPHELMAEDAMHLLEISQAEKDGRLVVLPPNDPLTLEELREMGGEPYWHVGLQKGSVPPHWNILEPFAAKHIENFYYGKNWLAYRRKPAEGEN